MRKITALAALAATGLAACDMVSGTTDGGATSEAAADADAVKALERKFIAYWEGKDPAAKALYAPDAVMMVPDSPPRRGVDEIAKSFERFVTDPAARFDATNATTVISAGGDLAFSQGTYTMRYTDDEAGAVVNTDGYYLLVYKKQSDGGWKVVQDVSSPLP